MLEIASNSGTRLSFSGNCIQKYWKGVGHVQNIYVVISKKNLGVETIIIKEFSSGHFEKKMTSQIMCT